MCTPSSIHLSQTPSVLYPQQYTTWKGQRFPVPVPPQVRSSSAPPVSLMGPRPNLDERTSQTIHFFPHLEPRPPRKTDIPLQLCSNLVYHYRHHTIHYWHNDFLKRYLHVIMYNKNRIHYFIKI